MLFCVWLWPNVIDKHLNQVTIHSLIISTATSFTPSPANDCATKCGSVNILFPFGLKQGCYRGKSFALTCNETSGPPLLLFNSHYKVSTLLLEEGQLKLERVNEYDYTFESERTRLFACFEEQTIVSWVIASQFCEDARKNMTTFACVDAHSSCFDTTTTNNVQDVSGYYCKCSQGYQGNPYLRNGCKGAYLLFSSL